MEIIELVLIRHEVIDLLRIATGLTVSSFKKKTGFTWKQETGVSKCIQSGTRFKKRSFLVFQEAETVRIHILNNKKHLQIHLKSSPWRWGLRLAIANFQKTSRDLWCPKFIGQADCQFHRHLIYSLALVVNYKWNMNKLLRHDKNILKLLMTKISAIFSRPSP